MIQHIKSLLILSFLIFSSCKEKNILEIPIKENNTVSKKTDKELKSKTFSFYKASSFCESNIGYFTEQEASNLYADKTIKLNIEQEQNENISSNYTKEKLNCISKKLDIGEIITAKYFKTEDVFPFDNVAFFNDKYIVISRDGYFFAFISENEFKKRSIIKEVNVFQDFELLINHKLAGLSIIDEKAVNPFKKYGLNFSTVCVCDSPSMYIDLNSKELIIFNSCDLAKSVNNIENKIIFKIVKIKNEQNKLIIATPNLKISFEKIDEVPIFKILVEGDFPKNYVGSDLKKVFTSEPDKFRKEDCGDFGG